jgi:hypothetical protein
MEPASSLPRWKELREPAIILVANVWLRVQIMKHLVWPIQFSPFSLYFLSLRSKYSPQHSVLQHPP